MASSVYSCCIKIEPEQPHIGNLALPPSQQPSTLYGFGQYVVDKGDTLIGIAPSFRTAKNEWNASVVFPYLIYGIRDDTVFVCSLPIAAELHEGCHSSSGLLDAILEIEYLFYEYQTETSNWEVSIEGSLVLPFGSQSKIPATGFGSPAFFAGIIARYLSTEWYWYVSTGGLFTTAHHTSRAGNTFLYQTGFGKNIGYESDKWLCMLMLEMNGNCTQKNVECCVKNPNTGGNLIALGPTIWFSTQRFIFQAGILPVIYQKQNGYQHKATLFFDLNMEWKF